MSTLVAKKKKTHLHEGSPVATVIMYVVAAFAALICLYPMWYVFCNSISDVAAVDSQKVWLYPIGFSIDAYKVIVVEDQLWRAYGMTIFYVVGSVLMMLCFCLLAAYPLTCRNMIGRKLVTLYFMIPMYFGAGLIPTYLTYRTYGFVDNIFTMIICHGYSIWYTILTRTYLLSIPEALRDSAKIDGANHFRTLFSILMPLAKPIIAVIAIYTVINVWNGWMTASLYILDKKLQPLQLYLRRVLVNATEKPGIGSSPSELAYLEQLRFNNVGLQYAMIIFTTLPVIMVYPFFQKYFVKGVMVGSVKG